ncbi:BTAD domain-containing putative transcriptional regulator [Jidongwangia harbinensis]|uniref:BTAD domain-containing putative transcriptional regulator n=1 Tax=Jidongwangia harbinensis TaxID=2878561 RepID=UPI003FD876FF
MALLGPVRAWVGDRQVHLGAARQRAVFAVLAVNANRLVTRDAIIDAVWGPSPPATAAGNIYTYVSGLRRSLAPGRARRAADDVLSSGPSGYTLRLAPDALDSELFQDLCAEAAARQDDGDLAGAAARLDRALGLWQGDALDGIAGHMLAAERTHLAARRLAAVERRARIAMELGDDGLVAELTALVEAHPLHEPLHELLMLALHRTGRSTEALEVFRAARRTLDAELGVEPGPALIAAHREILAAPAPASPRRPARAVVPTHVARAIRDGSAPHLYGRAAELERLRALVASATGGQGSTVWIEGEPGIGKTALLTAAFREVTGLGCQLAWAVADEFDRHVPLQVVMRALGVEQAFKPATGPHLDDTGPTPPADRVFSHVRALCADAPLILVLDDLQWADNASLLLWERLVEASRQMPLLLVSAARPEPNGRELAQMRRGVQAAEGHVLQLAPLPPDDVAELVRTLVGAPIGPHLQRIVPRAGGNPMCAIEMTATLLRRGVVQVVDGQADVDASVPVETPGSVLSVVRATVDFLSPETQDMLRLAAMLGTEFAVDDVVAVTGRSPLELMSNLEEALSVNVLVDAGSDLAFRHPILRQALYESIPRAVRGTLHRHTAEVLARGGSPATRVAKQLVAETPVVDGWVVEWLVTHHATVARRTPEIAGELLRHVLGAHVATAAQRETLLVALVKLEFRYGRRPHAEATEAIAVAAQPAHRAEMRQLLAMMHLRDGDVACAVEVLGAAALDPDVPELWGIRHRVMLADIRRGDLTDLDAADRNARRVHAEAMAAGLRYEAAFALQTIWRTNSVRRDHERALSFADQALDLVRNHPGFPGMYLSLLDNRVFTLQNLDRLDQAGRTLHEAARFAIRHRLPSSLQVTAAVHHYWEGRWDDAAAELSAVTEDAPSITFLGMREAGAGAMLRHGVAALIAGRRDDATLAGAHLDAADMLPATEAERENVDFLLVARALDAERKGRPDRALELLAPLLDPGYAAMMLRHQWLPDVVRLALATDSADVAREAAAICRAEAEKEVTPARAWAADARCYALLSGDPAPALQAAAHYRRVGRTPELAAACEEAAVLLAARRRPHEAAEAGDEAARLYRRLGARWDLRRVRQRLAEYGVDLA